MSSLCFNCSTHGRRMYRLTKNDGRYNNCRHCGHKTLIKKFGLRSKKE